MIVAGTGHRPKFLPCKYNEKHPWLLDLKKRTHAELERLGAEWVISGMAIGFDTWLAQVALEMGLKVNAYVPFRGQHLQWPSSSRREYERILEAASSILYLREEYTSDAFHVRDRAMVDDADKILALWDPQIQQGGTFYTVNYAKGKGKEVINLWNE